jgi:hypothetical protein
MKRDEMDTFKYNLTANILCSIDVDDDFYQFTKSIFEISETRRPNFE